MEDKKDFDRWLEEQIKEKEKFPRIGFMRTWAFNIDSLFKKIRRLYEKHF